MNLGALAVLIAAMATTPSAFRKKFGHVIVMPQAETATVLQESNASGEASVAGCSCDFKRHSWQQWPLASDGAGCIGGCGGSEFQIDSYGSVIKTIVVFFRKGNVKDYIKSIRVTYEDGQSVQKGEPVGRPRMFTFGPGEWVVGDLRLSGNGIGTRLGSIAFDTNLGRKFDVGKRDPRRYHFPTGGTKTKPVHIAGLSGSAGKDIDRLGVIFWKPIADTSYSNIKYPTLASQPHLSSPTEVRSRVFCNDGEDPMPATERSLHEVVTVGLEACLMPKLETQFTVGVKINGGIPFIKEIKGAAEWSITSGAGIENCKSVTKEQKESLLFPSFEIPPYTKVRQTYSQWSGSLASLPWTATLRVEATDGSVFENSVEGLYRGVAYNDPHFHEKFDDDVTKC